MLRSFEKNVSPTCFKRTVAFELRVLRVWGVWVEQARYQGSVGYAFYDEPLVFLYNRITILFWVLKQETG